MKGHRVQLVEGSANPMVNRKNDKYVQKSSMFVKRGSKIENFKLNKKKVLGLFNDSEKIKKIEDNTAEHVEILIHLPPNVSPDKTIDALYAFTSCENSISPLCCIIENNKPVFIGVSEILKKSTDFTVELLKTHSSL